MDNPIAAGEGICSRPSLALRMAAARRDPRNARELICDIFQEIVERYHAN
jgi:hypothetical protein